MLVLVKRRVARCWWSHARSQRASPFSLARPRQCSTTSTAMGGAAGDKRGMHVDEKPSVKADGLFVLVDCLFVLTAVRVDWSSSPSPALSRTSRPAGSVMRAPVSDCASSAERGVTRPRIRGRRMAHKGTCGLLATGLCQSGAGALETWAACLSGLSVPPSRTCTSYLLPTLAGPPPLEHPRSRHSTPHHHSCPHSRRRASGRRPHAFLTSTRLCKGRRSRRRAETRNPCGFIPPRPRGRGGATSNNTQHSSTTSRRQVQAWNPDGAQSTTWTSSPTWPASRTS